MRELKAIYAIDGDRGHYMGVVQFAFGGIGLGESPGKVTLVDLLPITIAHELGHNMSLGHAPCGILIRGIDPDYPYTGGAIGVWGYDPRGGELVPPRVPDLMGYCRSVWISDYHFTKAIEYRQTDFEPVVNPGSTSTRSLLLWGREERYWRSRARTGICGGRSCIAAD